MSDFIDRIKKGTSSNSLTTTGSNDFSALKSKLSNGQSSLDDRIKSMSAQALPQIKKSLIDLKEKTVELVFIFDRSGSCKGTENATVNGFYSLINNEKAHGFSTIVSTILFNNSATTIHDSIPVKDIPAGFNYTANGGTALYDTLYNKLGAMIRKHKELGANAPQNTLIVIATDGLDENSEDYNLDDIRGMIGRCMNLGWEFIFLGANINAKEVARSMGINTGNAENFNASGSGILLNFQAVKKALEGVREVGKIKPDWSTPIKNNLALGSGENDKDDVLKLGGK